MAGVGWQEQWVPRTFVRVPLVVWRVVIESERMTGTETAEHDPVDVERARLFALLGRLMGAAPDASLLAGLKRLRGSDGELGAAYAALAVAAGAATPEAAEREYFNLFIGVGRG